MGQYGNGKLGKVCVSVVEAYRTHRLGFLFKYLKADFFYHSYLDVLETGTIPSNDVILVNMGSNDLMDLQKGDVSPTDFVLDFTPTFTQGKR